VINLKISVIGGGPVGCVLAYALKSAGNSVQVVECVEELREEIAKGIELIDNDVTKPTVNFDSVSEDISFIDGFSPDYMIIATKTCSLPSVIDCVTKLNSKAPIVLAQNGIGNEEYVIYRSKGVISAERLYRIVINFNAMKEVTGSKMKIHKKDFRADGIVSSKIGSTTYNAKELEKIKKLFGSELAIDAVADIRQHVLKKTILNCALNSVCAVTGQTMADAMNDVCGSRLLAISILKEGLHVVSLYDYDFGKNALEDFIKYLESGGNHKPSMRIDIENKRLTEIDFQNGGLVRLVKAKQAQHNLNRDVNLFEVDGIIDDASVSSIIPITYLMFRLVKELEKININSKI
jgi:2-dehydropantoate 2-reductase